MPFTKSIKEASKAYIDLETYLFASNPRMNFANHTYTLHDLNYRFNELIKVLSEIDRQDPDNKQTRILRVNLVDVASTADKKFYEWSYYNHKFATSKGRDQEAMNKWHQLEDEINVNDLAQFKARREINLSFYVNIVKNHLFFNRIAFAKYRKPDPEKAEYGLDVAEEIYLEKTIEEYHAQNICHVSEAVITSPLIYLLKDVMEQYKLDKIRGHYVSNSRKLDYRTKLDLNKVFSYLNVREVPLESSDFVLLINDLDLLTSIPALDTNKPIFVADISMGESPNFGYILLKDPGFSQVYSFAKRRYREDLHDNILRCLVPGLLSFVRSDRFVDQIAINYMDDYFKPLSKSLNQPLKTFVNPISMLAQKLEQENV
jgi:hypothetical protein